MKPSVFIDTDILLDFLANRQPFANNAATVFTLADKGELSISVSALSFSNLNYLLSKQYNSNEAKQILQKFKTLVSVLPVNDKVVELALASKFTDFEDALQHFCALNAEIPILLTRNIKDYKYASLIIMTAKEFLASI